MRGRWLLAGVLLAGAGLAVGRVMLAGYVSPGPLASGTDLVIPRGGLASVAGALRRGGAIATEWRFKLAAYLTAWQGPLHAGEFAIPAHADLRAILLILRAGRTVQHRLTIPEGLTAAQIAELLAQAPGLTGDIVVPAEGSVLPETYLYERGTPADAIEARAQKAMSLALDQAWRGRAPDLPIRSKSDLLSLASLVERETHLPDERPLVAAVFYNRLRDGMRLQSDPTVIYGESGGGTTLAGGIERSALERWTPFNTYEVSGLPAVPICSPGLAALEAASHPAASQALYFVADGKGGHIFSDSLAEHARNVAHWRSLH